jgi:hypothetical protein
MIEIALMIKDEIMIGSLIASGNLLSAIYLIIANWPLWLPIGLAKGYKYSP